MRYIRYLCFRCGEGKRVVSMSCKSSMCLRCGTVYVDEWVSPVSKMLHEGIIYRHIVLTVPEELRKTFYNHAEELLGRLMACGVRCLDDFFSNVSRKDIRGGYIVVLQTRRTLFRSLPGTRVFGLCGGLRCDGLMRSPCIGTTF